MGQEFLEEVDGTVERIRELPRSAPEVRGPIRRVPTRRFPYGIFYVDEESAIVVLAVIHGRQNDSEWPTMPE